MPPLQDQLPLLGAVVASYLLGSIPFGLVIARVFKGVDLRKHGSGNIGATNVGRVIGKPFGVLAFVCDFGKGWVPTAFFSTWVESTTLWPAVLCGAAAVCGHVWPLYLKFKGGKAVATGCGALVALDPMLFLIGGVAWLVTLALFRYVGLASMVMGAAFPIAAMFRVSQGLYGSEVVIGALGLTVLILLRHRSNISRMMSGTEPRIGGPKRERESHA